ncbi:FAD-binding oxidoreductase [Actinomadura sp. KC345]|uniref:FAD-binding protein n=1 Tax=Actinomadura sp. KC345 TaxID=2530371 RepID=UPI0010496D2B|nr:FAD-binding protein [Actinomadura sp. KC345]TDC50232.1 FAD-binding oxidoreductase [Actinomadura sp. KC345]
MDTPSSPAAGVPAAPANEPPSEVGGRRRIPLSPTGIGTSSARVVGRSGVTRASGIAPANVQAPPAAVPADREGKGPPAFPGGTPVWREHYRNWSGETDVADVWTCAPRSSDEVAVLATWARANRYRLRPRGRAHTFAPLSLSGREHVLLADTRHLAGVEMASPATVRVGAGTTVDALAAFLEGHGLGLPALPAVGDLTVGGVLAVGAHGTGVAGASGPLSVRLL